MTKRIKLECLGDDVVMIVDKEKGVAFDGWDERAEMAFIGFGDTERSPCWIVARAIEEDRLNDYLKEEARKGNAESIKALVAAGADVDNTNDGLTLLHEIARWAPRHISRVVAPVLIECGASVNKKEPIWHRTPLHGAAYNGSPEAARILLKAGANVNAKDKKGKTPLHRAARTGETATAAVLLAAGANINAKEKEGQTPLHIALHFGHKKTATFLIENNALINVANSIGDIPLHVAAAFGNLEMIDLLIKSGSSIEKKNKRGRTPLHLAANLSSLETTSPGRSRATTKLLLEAGADVTATDESGQTPLDLAFQDTALLLIDWGGKRKRWGTRH